MSAAIVFGILGWGVSAFLMIRLLLEVDMRDQLQEDIHRASVMAQSRDDRDTYYGGDQWAPEDISILKSRCAHALVINKIGQNRFDRESV